MSAYSNKVTAKRLLELSSEVGRIANALARQTAEFEPERQLTAAAFPQINYPDIALGTVKTVIRGRNQRTRYFPEELFADPAWDIMLGLLEAEIANRRVSVSSACLVAGVPATTALRYLKILEEKGLVTRIPDPLDARRVWVELAPETSVAMRRWFAENMSGLDPK